MTRCDNSVETTWPISNFTLTLGGILLADIQK